MAANAVASAKQFYIIDLLLQQLLGKVRLKTWKTTVLSSLGTLLKSTSETTSHVE
jgi:hypothetical protein